MRTKSNTQIPSARSLSGEGWAAIIGAVGSVFLLAKKLLSPKPAHKPEWVTRPDFYAEMFATRERINATHLSILEKLDANYRELLCPGAAGHAHQYARSRPRPGGRRQSLRTMRAGVRQGACPLMHRIAVRGRMCEKGLRTVPGLWL
ncbi:MAG: hypothetical protein NT167_23545, partial [Verrucomicrobia bacterium]|nr:hypothetical protein [Verrucomicrobiota bacterium]